ncbi:MAG: hypothetical protein JNM30_06565 [Rhodospirillales bacterium]|nr:hypothetical protein [Rhodospirillales bacterium]
MSAIALMLVMLACLEAGRRVGRRRATREHDGAAKGIGAIDGAVFGLLGLLVAFTFSGATSRFDTRRHLIVQETNAIGTAYLRLDLLQAPDRAALRDAFKQYLDARLAAYRAMPDIRAARAALDRATDQQNAIWQRGVAACQRDPSPAPCTLLLPALNEMFDITTTRTMALVSHPPMVVYAMLFALAATSSLLAGYAMAESRTRRLTHMISFAATLSITVYVILDIEFPRLGLIRVDDFDAALIQLRATMDKSL